jgi:hypothetical protein
MTPTKQTARRAEKGRSERVEAERKMRLLLDDLWPTIAKLSKQPSHVQAATAYVSSAENLHLRAGRHVDCGRLGERDKDRADLSEGECLRAS